MTSYYFSTWDKSGNVVKRDVDEDEYFKFINAVKILKFNNELNELAHLFKSSVLGFENTLCEILNELAFDPKSSSHADHFDMKLKANRELLSLMSVGKMLTDLLPAMIRKRGFSDHLTIDEWKNRVEQKRKSSFGFRFFEQLRNLGQHEMIPISSFSTNIAGERTAKGMGSHFTLSFYISREQILETKSRQAQGLRHDVKETRYDAFDLTYIARQYTELCFQLLNELFDSLGEQLQAAQTHLRSSFSLTYPEFEKSPISSLRYGESDNLNPRGIDFGWVENCTIKRAQYFGSYYSSSAWVSSGIKIRNGCYPEEICPLATHLHVP